MTPAPATTTVLPDAPELWSHVTRATRWQRVSQFAFTRVVLGVVLGGLLGGLEYFAVGQPRSDLVLGLAAVAMTSLYICVIWALAKLVERRPARELSLALAPFEWLMGLALGVLLLGATVAVLVGLDAYHVQRGGTAHALVEGVVMFVPHALLEEIIFRVVLFKISEEALGSVAAIAIEAAVFGAAHGGNTGATVVSTIAIAVEAGMLLAAAFLYTRRIWLVWGLHVGWNYAQGTLFGIAVSGLKVDSFLQSQPSGPTWLTGGAFGVEASPVAVVFCLVAAIALLRAARRRGQIVGYGAQRERVRQLVLPPHESAVTTT